MAYECKLIECYSGFGPTVTTDGNMENDPTTNWPGTNANVAEETANVHAGCLALKVTATANFGYASQSVTVEEGHRYRIGAWGLRSAAGHQWRLRIYIAGSVVWTGDWHNNAAWEEEVKFYRIPDGITTIQLRLEIETDTEICYFDDVSVTRESPVPMTEIDLQYNPTLGFSLLNRGIQPARPERVSLYGGRLELELVRQEDGKRRIPLRLVIEGSDGEDLIDRVNALEEMLDHAARYRKDDWGGEVFLVFKITDATHNVWFPVLEGEIVTDRVYEMCGGEPDDMIKDLPVLVTCEPYWESDFTYDLSNLLDNPGFEEWNDGICNSEPDCWDDYSTAGAVGENQQETDTVEEGCEALRITMATGVAAGAYQGVTQDITARLRADTEYTLLAWVQNTDIFVNCVAQVYTEGQNSGITYALNSGAANADYTMYECQFTPNVTDIANWVEIRLRILTNDVNATGLIHIDKVLVMESSNVPTGWMSSSYLTNHYDRDANQINFLSVCDIPGEAEAECALTTHLDDATSYMRIAKRTRDEPCEFIWELLTCDAYTKVETAGAPCNPGLTNAVLLFDSDKTVDATAPCGCRITVDFVGRQTMADRAYWDITSNLTNHYGKFVLFVIAKVTGTTDTVKIEPHFRDETGYQLSTTEIEIDTTDWALYDGWEVFSFRIGTHNDDLFGTGNNWRITLGAETTFGAPTDELHIATVYLAPIDEGLLVAGQALIALGAGLDMTAQEMDGDRGAFAYASGTDTHYPNLGAVGQFPLLTPKIENWLYFVTTNQLTELWTLNDTYQVSLKYRPRGIFLRGANP